MAKSVIGKLVNIRGSKVTIELSDEIDVSQFTKLSDGKQPELEVFIDDGRSITVDQRKKIFAMLNDIAEYTGYSLKEIEYLMKCRFMCLMKHPQMFHFGYPEPCSVTLANNFLTFVIDFCIKEDIPFKTKVIDEIVGDYRLVRECVLHRKCVLCGKLADIDHVKAVGMGRNRRTINQHGMYVLPLCRRCHQRAHQMGHVSFLQAYQLKPIKLDDELIRKLKLTNVGELEKQND